MNIWLKEIIADYLIVTGGVNPACVADIVDGLASILAEKHMIVAPSFLSDEMFNAQLAENPQAIYEEKRRDYATAVGAYRQMSLTDLNYML